MNEVPDWNRGDRLKSIIEVASIARVALAECVIDTGKWIDKKIKEKTDDPTTE